MRYILDLNINENFVKKKKRTLVKGHGGNNSSTVSAGCQNFCNIKERFVIIKKAKTLKNLK